MFKTLLKIHKIKGDIGAASRGPRALAKHLARRAAHQFLNRALR